MSEQMDCLVVRSEAPNYGIGSLVMNCILSTHACKWSNKQSRQYLH